MSSTVLFGHCVKIPLKTEGFYAAGNANNAVKSGNSALEMTLPADVILHHQTNNINLKKNKAMKTTKILSVLSLALFLSAAISASSANINKQDGPVSVNPVIRHLVNINVFTDRKICNEYLVEILDRNGKLVAPAKRFIQGVAKYDFYERGSAAGVRVAVLVPAPLNNGGLCETILVTEPARLSGHFFPGQTYQYDLIPKVQSSIKD